MSSPLACVVCSVDPQTSSLLLPLAQATILAAPVLLRDRIGRAVRALRARRRPRDAARDAWRAASAAYRKVARDR